MFTGNWADLFSAYADDHSDLIAPGRPCVHEARVSRLTPVEARVCMPTLVEARVQRDCFQRLHLFLCIFYDKLTALRDGMLHW